MTASSGAGTDGGKAQDRFEGEPAQRATRRRLAALGRRANLELGQNFLVDDNLHAAVVRAAELDRTADVALEVGGGLGTLSERIAGRARHLHVVEVDPGLRPALEDAVGARDDVTLHFADAVRLDLGALDPAPTKLVSNLPYGIAATVLLRAATELPSVALCVAMVQREVAERLAAAPGSRIYGATSVIAGLCCEVRMTRRVPASVFEPRPYVESAVVELRRHSPPPDLLTLALVHAAFAHRRKALAGSLALAPGAPAGLRDATRVALERLGHPSDARAERLHPADFEALRRELGDDRLAPLGASSRERR